MQDIPSLSKSGLDYRNWIKRYFPAKYEEFRKKHNIYCCNHRRQQAIDDPAAYAEENRIRTAKYRANSDTWDAYQREYQKRWLADPINKRVHRLTVTLRDAIHSDKKRNVNYACIKKNLQWMREKLEATPGSVVSHIIPIRHLIRFDFDMPLFVIHDLENIEISSRAENSKLRHFITDASIAVAEILERKYPAHCKGLVKWLKNEQPDYQPAHAPSVN